MATTVLAYPVRPTMFADFMNFAKNGKRNADGSFEFDDDPKIQALKTGVINWLVDQNIGDVHFFATKATDPFPMVAAVCSAPTVSWVGMPGFKAFLRDDNVKLDNTMLELEPQPQLDDLLIQRKHAALTVTDPAARKSLFRALGGDKNHELSKIGPDVSARFNITTKFF